MDEGCAHRLFDRPVGRSVARSVGWCVEYDMSKCCINGGALICATLTSCLRERTECGRSSFLPIYPLFVCESVLGISIDC